MVSISFTGKLQADAQIKELNKKKVLYFNVEATDEFTVVGGGVNMVRRVLIGCRLWDKPWLVDRLREGVNVFIVGKPALRTWIDRDEDESTFRACIVNTIEVLTKSFL